MRKLNVKPERPVDAYPVLGKLDEITQAIVRKIGLRRNWVLFVGEDGRWRDISSGH